MLQKETFPKKKKNDLLQVSELFLYNKEVRVKQIVEKTGFSRKKVWILLKTISKAGGVKEVRKGVYEAVFPRLSEFRVNWGGVEWFTMDKFIDLLKKGEVNLLKEQNKENPATLWINYLDLSSEISNFKEEQERLDWIKSRVYEVLKESKNPGKFRAYAIFGCLYWEEEECHTAEFEGIKGR